MSQYGNSGVDRREGNTSGRRWDEPAPISFYGSREYWSGREAKANELIARGGDSAEVGRASWRNIAAATVRKPKN